MTPIRRRLVGMSSGGFLALGLAAAPVAAPAATEGAAHPFDDIARVMTHPRCLNCHTQADTPRQGDDRRIHRPPVRRGAEGKGVSGLYCAGCHGARNDEASNVPGAPNWQLPRHSMGWVGHSPAMLCRALTDRAQNGDLALFEIVAHVEADPLLRWAWEPGSGRSTPPLAHPEFVAAVQAWAAAGAPCPED